MKRSPREILFRLRQESANIWLAFGPGFEFGEAAPSVAALPLGRPETFLAQLQGGPYAGRIVKIAEGVLRREFSLLGYSIQTEREVHWRRDYVSGRESGLRYFRRIPYLDAAQVGDHKVIWELNRHQHLVTMAQAYLLTGRDEFLEDLWAQLRSWLDQNLFCRGMNWTSALEVAFRALSWMWIEHLAGSRMPETLRRPWLAMLFQHGRYLEHNLSIYFSPNTHLQGEALALHALGVLFQGSPAATQWRQTGAAILEQIIQTHVRPDGSHFEQSSYYHIYAMDMFLFHAVLEPVSPAYLDRLKKMAEYLWALASSGNIPLLGDDDGGRLFSPYGPRREFANGTLAACAAFLGDTPWNGNREDLYDMALWWFGERASLPAPAKAASKIFRDSGVAVLIEKDVHLIADTQAFGFGGAGHSHAHALHFTLRRAQADVLIDPGTYTYVADLILRDHFRGTAAHNTIRIDGQDQASPAGPFRWKDLPHTELVQWSDKPWLLNALCRYRGLTHNRQIAWSGGVLFVLDRIQGIGVHRLEQFWHPGGPVQFHSPTLLELPARVYLALPALPSGGLPSSRAELAEGGDFGWYSRAPGERRSRPVIRIDLETSLPCSMAAAFIFAPLAEPAALRVVDGAESIRLECGVHWAEFQESGSSLQAGCQ